MFRFTANWQIAQIENRVYHRLQSRNNHNLCGIFYRQQELCTIYGVKTITRGIFLPTIIIVGPLNPNG